MPDDFFNNLDRLRLTAAGNPVGNVDQPRPAQMSGRRVRGEFLKGPIPLAWLTAASKLTGKSPLAVGLAIWFEAGRRCRNEVRLTTAILERFGVNRKAKYRALGSLEDAGLIRVRRELRKNPVVTILEVKDDPAAGEQDRDVTGSMPPAADDRVLKNENLGGT